MLQTLLAGRETASLQLTDPLPKGVALHLAIRPSETVAELLLVLLAAAAFLIEVRAARRWSPAYWTSGIIVFRAKCHALSPRSTLPRTTAMELRFMDTQWPTLDFKPIEPELIAFKENYSNARYAYTQVMRGYLSFDRKSGTVEVVGLLNYFALAFLLALVSVGFVDGASSGFIFTFGGLLVLGMCYAIQARRYDAVLSAAAAEWGQDLAPAQGTDA